MSVKWWSLVFVYVFLASCSGKARIAYVRQKTDWVIPNQVGSPAFWGASTKTVVTDPMPLAGKDGTTRVSGQTHFPHMSSIVERGLVVWRDPKPERFDWEEKGWWRMTPKTRYEEVSRNAYNPENKLISTTRHFGGAMSGSGEMFRLKPATFAPLSGWRVKSQKTVKRKIPVTFHNPAGGGGGISYRLSRQIDLSEAEIRPDQDYYVFMEESWDNPYSQWEVSKPVTKTREELNEAMVYVLMDPVLWVEFKEIKLVEDATGKEMTVTQPTGWAMGAGRFHRDGVSR